MHWFYLLVAGLFESMWAIGLKHCDGLRRPALVVVTTLALALSMLFLNLALRRLPLATAYAAWTGLGIAGTVLYEMARGETAFNATRVACLGLIALAIFGLHRSDR